MEEKLFDIEYKDLEDIQFLSKGNYGELFKASYFGTDVAVKKLLYLENRAMHKYIERELSLLKTMRHPNIVQYMGICRNDKEIYLVMEYVEGGDLFDKLRDPKLHLSWKKRVELALETCQAVCYLHSKGVIHRDLKSQNLLVDKNLKVKICDFGFARSRTETKEYMTVCGTDEWIAPEILLGEKYDMTADVFSFGMILCELITRQNPPKREPGNAYAFNFADFRKLADKTCPEQFLSCCEDCTKLYPEERADLKDILKRLKELSKSLPNRNNSEDITTVDLAKELNATMEVIDCSNVENNNGNHHRFHHPRSNSVSSGENGEKKRKKKKLKKKKNLIKKVESNSLEYSHTDIQPFGPSNSPNLITTLEIEPKNINNNNNFNNNLNNNSDNKMENGEEDLRKSMYAGLGKKQSKGKADLFSKFRSRSLKSLQFLKDEKREDKEEKKEEKNNNSNLSNEKKKRRSKEKIKNEELEIIVEKNEKMEKIVEKSDKKKKKNKGIEGEAKEVDPRVTRRFSSNEKSKTNAFF